MARVQLTEVDRVEVGVPDIARDAEGSLTLSALLTVAQRRADDLRPGAAHLRKSAHEALQSGGCTVDDIDGVVLVGGQSKSRSSARRWRTTASACRRASAPTRPWPSGPPSTPTSSSTASATPSSST
ncbi:MAG: hypothetical protein R3F43_26090 [bacterium]